MLQLPAEGFEAYRDMGYSFNGHPMLHATVNVRSGHEDGKAINVCCACGAFFSVERLARALLRACLRESAASGLRRQLARIGEQMPVWQGLSLIHISEPTRPEPI
eukprot:5559942-Pyramimonas_sp.AAC.1